MKLQASAIPSLLIGALIALPVLLVVSIGILQGGGDSWTHIRSTLLTEYLIGTIAVLVLFLILLLAIAVPFAWLVSMYDFPGRKQFEWLLILPLSAPGYVVAYAYADFLGAAGPIQSFIQDASGLRAKDYWFPDIHSVFGLATILAFTLYPYVYLTARAAFSTQAVGAIEAARMLGATGWRRFRNIAVPFALPAIAAGATLALMEAAADYGAAEHLGVPTLTYGIVRAWDSFGEPATGARLALFLLGIIVLFLLLQQLRPKRGSVSQDAKRWRQYQRPPLHGLAKLFAPLSCAVLLSISFIIPIGRLVWLAMEGGASHAPILGALKNTLILAGLGAGVALLFGMVIALSSRLSKPAATISRFAAASGYAVPGAILSVGVLALLSLFEIPLLGSTAIALLVWVYACRFTAAGSEPIQAALQRAPKSVPFAAQCLGAGPFRRAISIDLPIAWSGASVAAIILFVEILKELPATLMLRPTNWDSLAVRAYTYASDERLAAAAIPCLLITLAGLIPVIILSRQLAESRPGGNRSHHA